MPRTLVGISLLIGAIAATLGWWIARPQPLEPPRIEALGSMDPEVAALLRELRAAIEQDRSSANAWGRFAMGCEANGFVGAARAAYETAFHLAPDEPRWAYRLALVTSRLGEHESALATLTRVNELAPDYGPAWCRRGLWLLDRADAAGAEQAFNRALALDANDPAASIGLARVHLQRREHNRAAVVLEGVLERQPGDRYALQLLGTAYRRLGRIDDASFALAVGASGEPSWRDPWSAEVGEFRRGFATLLKAATAEAMAGRLDRALPILEELRRRNPDDVSLANHTAEVLMSAGRAGDAIRLLTPMQGGRANAETHLALASAYLASGDVALASEHADRAIATHAPGARALALKGLIAWRGGTPDEAMELFEQARVRDPRDVKLLAWIGLIHLETGRTRDAASEFSDVLRRDPLQPDALAGLAMARHALGAREEAALALARAEQIAPDHPRVKEARARLGEQGDQEIRRKY
jgi:tetratricopeptide (TPR) repeat protein